MLDATRAYKAAVVGDSRKILLRAILEVVDPDITYGAVSSSDTAPFSRPDQLRDGEMESVSNYITLEANRWLLGGGFAPVPDGQAIEGQIGVVSHSISDVDGIFSNPPWCQLSFHNVSILQACSLFFPASDVDGVAKDFVVDIYQGDVVRHTESITGNLEPSVILSGFTVYNPDAIRITVTKWSLPMRRMRTVEIIPGLYERWDNDMLATFSVKQQGDVSCLSLPYGTCSLRMDNVDRRFEPRNKDGVFQSIEERQSIPVSIGTQLEDGSTEYKQVGVYYQYAGGWRTGDNGLSMQWDLVDIVGLIAKRTFLPPTPLPTTLAGWVAALAAQLGTGFVDCWHVDPDYAELPLTCGTKDITDKKCGDILRWICMATGTWPRAASDTGYLTVEPLWHQGNELTLDNLEGYPVIRANDDLACIIFTLNDGDNTKITVSGNSTSASKTVSVSNPFIKTQADALTAARLILSTYGGNKLETTGRGDPASEIGDVDTVWLNESSATTGRRIMQTFAIQDGVLRSCQSTLLQADGSFLYEERVVLTESGFWQAPSGVTTLRIIVVGVGEDGSDGADGSWFDSGENGANGRGAQVWASTVNINDSQLFEVFILDTGTTFGDYSSADGTRYPYGYTDIASGDSFARTGVTDPLPGSGDGGKGGAGGGRGNRHTETVDGKSKMVIDNRPGKGTTGARGATGCVVIYYDKVEGVS